MRYRNIPFWKTFCPPPRSIARPGPSIPQLRWGGGVWFFFLILQPCTKDSRSCGNKLPWRRSCTPLKPCNPSNQETGCGSKRIHQDLTPANKVERTLSSIANHAESYQGFRERLLDPLDSCKTCCSGLSPPPAQIPKVPPMKLKRNPETEQWILGDFFNISQDGEGENNGECAL